MSSTRPFLLLPGEIRNLIYSYLTPINGPIKSYAGIFLSCKQINTEYPPVAINVIDRFIRDFENSPEVQASGIQLSHPTRFNNQERGDIGHLCVDCPTLRIWHAIQASSLVILAPLTLLHLTTMEMKVFLTLPFQRIPVQVYCSRRTQAVVCSAFPEPW